MAETATPPVTPVTPNPHEAEDRANKLFDAVEKRVVKELSNGNRPKMPYRGLLVAQGLMSLGATKKESDEFCELMDDTRERVIAAISRGYSEMEPPSDVVTFLAMQEVLETRLLACATVLTANEAKED